MSFVATICGIEKNSNDMCMIMLKNEDLVIRVSIKYESLEPMNGDTLEFKLEKLPSDIRPGTLTLLPDYDIGLTGTIFALIGDGVQNCTYITGGRGFTFSVNRIFGQADENYFIQIKKIK